MARYDIFYWAVQIDRPSGALSLLGAKDSTAEKHTNNTNTSLSNDNNNMI